jgi:3-oxoacyl-[acyl-carrier-protein] synthase II
LRSPFHLGHTLGACGGPDCIMAGRQLQCEYVMNNNFAFGGVNTSLIFKRMS